jgi:peptide/nickel transport system substrate-binding protein
MDVFHSFSLIRRGAVLCALAACLSACGGDPPAGASGSAPLVMARVKDATFLDPAHAEDGLSFNTTDEVFEGLVTFRPGTFQLAPALATKWAVGADGKTWTFTLRPHAMFTDGTPADASAVKFNVDRWRLTTDPAHGSFAYPFYADVFGGFPGFIVGVKAPTPSTVVITLAKPLGPFLRDLAEPAFVIGSPTAIRRDPHAFEQKPVGSGPYEVAEWVKDDHITLTANPSYNGTLPKPAFQTVIIRDIPDQATSVLSIEKGDIAMLTDPRPDDAKSLASNSGVNVVEQPPNNLAYVAMNMDKKPFDNLLVRRAVAYALDLPGIVKGLYAPGAIVADNWTPKGILGENATVRAYPHDVAKARELLKEAGLPNGFATDLFYPTAPRPYMPEPQRLAETIQAQLQQVGIAVTLQPFEFGVFLSKVRNGEHQMCLIGWSGDNGDPDNFMYTLLDQDSAHKGSAQNYAFWRDPKFHALMLAGQATVDEQKRKVIYQQANALIHDQVPAISIVHTSVPIIVSSALAGFVPSPDTQYHFELMTTRTK